MADVALVERLRAAGCVFAEDEAQLLRSEAGDDRALEAMTTRRIAGEPLEHVVGWARFCDLRIAVGPGVFVPRPRTEALALHAVELVQAIASDQVPVVVDLCCGSGAIGYAVARLAGRELELHAADVDAAAVAVARRNLGQVGAQVSAGDLFDALPPELRGRVDVLTANVPYVPTDDVATMPSEARDHEPLVALDGGDDGLGVLARVAAGASTWLAPGGWMLSEVTPAQVEPASRLLTSVGLEVRVHRDEDLDATVLVARRQRTSVIATRS